MSDITHKFVDQLPAAEVAEVAAHLGLSVEQARHSTRTLAEWHRRKLERGEVRTIPLGFAMRMADAGLSDQQIGELRDQLRHDPYIDASQPPLLV